MKKILRMLIPPHPWKLPVIILLGGFFGMTLYALVESNAVSYLSDDPQTCTNCHVMTPQYATWARSSHKEVATCNDCHVPHDNLVEKYFFKAKDGLYHASVFTSRNEPEVIRIKEAGAEVVQQNCIRCHKDQVSDARLSASVENHFDLRTGRKCWECHQETPHGSVHSLSSVKYYGKVPTETKKNVPDWLNEKLK